MAVTHQPARAAQGSVIGQPTRPPVDEMIQNRHETAVLAGVESPSRAAGGFPTLGGGVGADPGADMARPVTGTPPDVVAAGGGAA
jgi:hypothetical protein